MGNSMGECPICSGRGGLRQLHAHLHGTQSGIYRCNSCSTELVWPQPTSDQIRGMYQAGYYRSWGMEAGENDAVALMKKQTFGLDLNEIMPLRSRGRLLDVGTASGFLLEVAQSRGFEPYGVEMSEYAGGLAAKKFGVDRVHIGTLETAPFAAGSFSVVTMTDLLEHVTSPVDTLKAAHRLLGVDGVLLVVTPNTRSLTRKLMGGNWSHYKAEHLFYFNPRSMAIAAGNAGFEVARICRARKALTPRYIRTQMAVYPHWLLTPAARLLNGALALAADRPLRISVGEMLCVLRKMK